MVVNKKLKILVGAIETEIAVPIQSEKWRQQHGVIIDSTALSIARADELRDIRQDFKQSKQVRHLMSHH